MRHTLTIHVEANGKSHDKLSSNMHVGLHALLCARNSLTDYIVGATVEEI